MNWKTFWRNFLATLSVTFGTYLVLFHDPLTGMFAPKFGHAAIGLGTAHWLHFLLGVLLIADAIFLWKKR